MTAWQQLVRQAAADNLELFRTEGGVTIYTVVGSIRLPLLTITLGELDDADGEKVLRQLTTKALELLKGLGS